MKKEQLEQSVTVIETTIGELVEAITDIALESGRSEEEGYELASLTLGKILGYQEQDYGHLLH